MSVYVDMIRGCLQNRNWPYSQSCHLFADTIEELHSFALLLGLKRSWFQLRQRKYSLPHYDLTVGMRAKAVRAGAVELGRREAVDLWREKGWACPKTGPITTAPPATCPDGRGD